MVVVTPDSNATASLNVVDQNAPVNDFGGGSDLPGNETDASAPIQSQAGPITPNVKPRSTQLIQSNALDDYIDVIYNISLGMLNATAKESLQSFNTTRSESGTTGRNGLNLDPSQYVIFASTGEQVTNNTTYQGSYYNIKSLTFNSFVGHIPQNPMVAMIWDAKMKLVQPYGFSWREDMDVLAKSLGYLQAAAFDYVYRMEIWFSGYSPTGKWVPKIPVQISDDNAVDSIIYYPIITTAEATLGPGGAVYDLSLQVSSHLATRAEVIALHHDNIGADSSSGSGQSVAWGTTDTFRQLTTRLAERLKKQVSVDSQGHIDATYEFVGPKSLFDATFREGGKIDFSSGVSFSDDSGSYSFSGANVDLYTFLYHVMGSLKVVRDLHLREDEPTFVEPGCNWNIRTQITNMSEKDDQTNQYKRYTFRYTIEPVLSYRHRSSEVEQRNNRVDLSVQTQRAEKLIQYGMLVRVYEYLFNNQNSEIVDAQFKFKNFYFEQFPYERDTLVGLAQDTNNTDAQRTMDDRQKRETLQNQQTQNTVSAPDFYIAIQPSSNSGSSLQDVLGIPAPPQGANNQRDYAAIHQHYNRGPVQAASQHHSAQQVEKQKFLRSRDQYHRWDMLSLQLTVRFDPVWLLNPYMDGGDFTATLNGDTEKNAPCNVHMDRVVFLKIRVPDQKNYLNPQVFKAAADRESIISGFYQVLTIVNEFEGGKYIQKLNMFKYPHFNYFDRFEASTLGTNTSSITGTGTSSVANISPDAGAGLTLG